MIRKFYKNLEGMTFGYLTVINKLTDCQESIYRNKWLCKCICGKEKRVQARNLILKNTKSCGCRRTEDLTNQIFNKLKVIKRFTENNNRKNKDVRWLCRCECGKDTVVTSHHLKHSGVKSCGCIVSYSKYEEMYGGVLSQIKHSAKERNILVNITREQIWDLFIKQNRKCALTGLEIKFSSKSKLSDGTASLDRIDSDKDYTIDNVQWVHKDINIMKQDLKESEFIKYCQLIVNNKLTNINKPTPVV